MLLPWKPFVPVKSAQASWFLWSGSSQSTNDCCVFSSLQLSFPSLTQTGPLQGHHHDPLTPGSNRSEDGRALGASYHGGGSSCPGGRVRGHCAHGRPSAEPEGPDRETETGDQEAVLPGVESSGGGGELQGEEKRGGSGPSWPWGRSRRDCGERWSVPVQPAVGGAEDIWEHWRSPQVVEEGTGEATLPFCLLQ